MGDRPEKEPRNIDDDPIKPWSSFLLRDFALIWFAGALTGTAAQVRQVAQLYQVYEISGSSLKLGLTGFFQALPYIFLGLFAGALADSFDRKRLIVTTQFLNVAPSFALGVLTVLGAVQVWHLYVLSLVSSLIQVFNGPARSAMIPRLVPRSHLMNAITLNAMTHQGSMLIGPPIAGLLIDHIGLGWTYVFCASLYIPALVSVGAIGTSGQPAGERRRVNLRSMIEGLEFIWAERIIFSLFLLDFGVMLVGYYLTVLPIFASDVFQVGATGLGTLYAANALGALLGMGVLLLFGNIRRKGAWAVVSALLFAGGLAFLGASRWFWLGVVAVAFLGLTDAVGVAVRRTVIQTLAPDVLMGRAASLMAVFAQCTNALGALVVGAAAALMGVSNALLVGGVTCVFIVLGISRAVPQLWRYRSDSATERAEKLAAKASAAVR